MNGAEGDDLEAEASTWVVRLNTTKVDLETLQAFQAWRRDPVHHAAYEKVSRIWKDAGQVRKDPAVADAIEQAKARIATSCRRERLPSALPLIATLSGALGVMILAAPLMNAGAARRYETAVGEVRQITLPDGSVVSLDTHSAIEVRYTKSYRTVRLISGQAMFEVVHRSDRPFHVKADGLDISDIGTVFDVRGEGGLVHERAPLLTYQGPQKLLAQLDPLRGVCSGCVHQLYHVGAVERMAVEALSARRILPKIIANVDVIVQSYQPCLQFIEYFFN